MLVESNSAASEVERERERSEYAQSWMISLILAIHRKNESYFELLMDDKGR